MRLPEEAALDRFYDSLWESATEAFARGEVKVDEYLRDREADRRRGLTVMLRLEEATAHAVGALIEELKQIEPGQYFYTPGQCHVTVLSLRTATSDYVHEPERIAEYAGALGEALADVGAFTIRFEGVTATPEAVMVCGFPERDALNHIRQKIFDLMEARGLPVKQRYLPKAAHVTVMRFSRAAENPATLAEKLRTNRERFFGASAMRSIELVENDWYMSPEKLRPIRSYPLRDLKK